jgi:hypothetical protein
MDVTWYCWSCGKFPNGEPITWNFVAVGDSATYRQIVDVVTAQHATEHTATDHKPVIVIE